MKDWFYSFLETQVIHQSPANFEIWQKWQDWIGIDQVLKIWFYTKIKFWLSLNGDWFLPKTVSNPSNINTWCIPIKKNRKIALETLFQCSKNRGAQASGNPTSSRFQSFLRCLTHSLASPESIQTLTLHKTIQNHRIRVWFVLENLKFDFTYSCIINIFCCCFCD